MKHTGRTVGAVGFIILTTVAFFLACASVSSPAASSAKEEVGPIPLPAKRIGGPSGIGAELRQAASSMGAEEKVRLKIILEEQVDPAGLEKALAGHPTHRRKRIAVSSLKRFAAERQRGVIGALNNFKLAGKATRIRPLWILNAITAEATLEVAEALVRRPEVARVDIDER